MGKSAKATALERGHSPSIPLSDDKEGNIRGEKGIEFQSRLCALSFIPCAFARGILLLSSLLDLRGVPQSDATLDTVRKELRENESLDQSRG
jgi:hypothetical protein